MPLGPPLRNSNPPPPTQVWDQQPGETPQAYAGFVVFRDLGVERSINATWRVRRPVGNTTQNAPGRYRAWAVQWRWQERAVAYDRWVESRRAVAEDRISERQISTDQIERSAWRALIPVEEVNSAKLLIAKGRAELDLDHEEKPNKYAAVQMIELGHKLYRLAAQMPVRVETEDGGDMRELFFHTSGQLEAALPPGVVPTMPPDPTAPPPRSVSNLHGQRGGIATQPGRRERP
jgi:hypothetical protein